MCLGQDAAKVKTKRMHPKEYRVHPIVFLIVLIVFPLLGGNTLVAIAKRVVLRH